MVSSWSRSELSRRCASMTEYQQMTIFDILDQDSWFGKTSPEPSVQTMEKTSEPSSKKPRGSQIKMPLFLDLRRASGHHQDASWEMGGALLGEYTMHSFGECPKEERESRLSQILQGGVHRKYFLSERACQGILRRAEKRGKVLPPILKETLEKQSHGKSEQDVRGGQGNTHPTRTDRSLVNSQ